MMTWAKQKMMGAKKKLHYFAFVLLCGSVMSVAYISNLSSENTYDRIQAGQWVVASMYWEDKLVSTGKSFDPIGWHAAHRTLPIGTLIRVSNPKNHRSINVTINDRGPFTPDRDLDLSLGAGALLGFKGLGTVYMEVLSISPVTNIKRPIVESLFAVNDANANCVGKAAC
jgi:rare lipoprotein A (peptidoglycan hydrolase)